MIPSITLYDIPCKTPNKSWSPNTIKTRYTLLYKGIPFKTEWVEYPDIAAKMKSLGAPPTSYNADGTPNYTCPAILDKSTGAVVSDSILIAEYLEETYPNTPTVFPKSSKGFQYAFCDAYKAHLIPKHPLIIPKVVNILNPRSLEYFRRTREAALGKPLEQLIGSEEEKRAAWKQFRQSYDIIGLWYSKTEGQFLLGNEISFADILVAAHVSLIEAVWGEDSDDWKDFATWGGKWIQLRDVFSGY